MKTIFVSILLGFSFAIGSSALFLCAATACRDFWDGTAPFCSGGPCPHGYIPVAKSKWGNGGYCWTGKKVLCKCDAPGSKPACVATYIPGSCGARATCETFNPLTSSLHSGEHFCVCQAGYRATGVAPTNADLQYHVNWQNSNGNQTHRVFVRPGQDCTGVCDDVGCGEVAIKNSCL